MKVTMIIGQPCVGKSLLIRELMKTLGPWEFHSVKFVPYHSCLHSGLRILGRYDEPHQFPGTDRMSMAAQPHVVSWLGRASDRGVTSVVFEGDRLGNISMLKSMIAKGFDIEVIHLWLRDEYLDKRRAAERNQSETFLRSRKTKVVNLATAAALLKVPVMTREHCTLADTHAIIAHIRKNRV